MLGPASGDYRRLRMPKDHGLAIECRRRIVLLCLWTLHHDMMPYSPPVLIPRYTGLHDYFAQRLSLVSGLPYDRRRTLSPHHPNLD